MTRFRRRLILIFLVATVAPLCLTLWVGGTLLERNRQFTGADRLDRLSRTLENTARQFYQREREALRRDAASGLAKPTVLPLLERGLWSADVEEFYGSSESDRFLLRGDQGDLLVWLCRADDGSVLEYSRSLGDTHLEAIRRQHAESRQWIAESRDRDLRRAFLLLAVVPWVAALAVLVFAAHRVSSAALETYQRMAHELEQSRERLLYLTRLESWQALARKMAHEVKNSLTPIRLTMEEMAARHHGSAGSGESFEQQAARIVAEEVTSLERRVRAFSELASEPPVELRRIDLAAMLTERVALLEPAHPGVSIALHGSGAGQPVLADEDLLKAVFTNLIENAAQAAGRGGRVRVEIGGAEGRATVEVHDSGPGLSAAARESLFEPTISFKKGGMGIGLSIARKSAVLCGGDVESIDGKLGGAGFRVTLNPAEAPAPQAALQNFFQTHAQAHSHS
ncbi:MAG: ATP-binding protein [Bryobacteraceae bacterium]